MPTNSREAIAWFTGLALRLSAALAFVPPLLTRLVIGQAFFLTGRGKLANFGSTVEFFAGLGIPLPELNAAFVSRLEFYGGALLVVGLATRLVALGLASTMVVALATADKATFLAALTMSGEQGLTDVTPLVYLLFLGWLATEGAGPASLDSAIARFWRLRRQAAAPVSPSMAAPALSAVPE
jgi:putative oxidoreductase